MGVSWNTVLGGALVLVGGFLGHVYEMRRARTERSEARADRRLEQRVADLRQLQDDVTDLQRAYVELASTLRAGVLEVGLIWAATDKRQELWKGVARIGDQGLWDLVGELVGASAGVSVKSSTDQIDSAMDTIGAKGSGIQKRVGQLLNDLSEPMGLTKAAS
jgi:hypothetical protein